jgi:hypothetical protein
MTVITRLLLRLLLLALPGLLLIPCPSWATQKLFLKDGSYQVVSSYEVHGDRVRYYSVERSAWEELPASLVDFEATKRAQEEVKAAEKKVIEEAKELEKERFEKPENLGFEIAPGIHLPKDEGVYSFDGARVIPLVQSSAQIVTDKKRAALLLAVPGPLLKSRSLVVLPGAQAAVRLQQAQPTFYVQSADGLGAKVQLIRIKSSKEARVVEKLEVRQGLGKPAESRATLPLERTQVAPDVYKVKPTQALDPGEYALGELMQDKLNLEVWDFGVLSPLKQ